jgi:hypothetical protein
MMTGGDDGDLQAAIAAAHRASLIWGIELEGRFAFATFNGERRFGPADVHACGRHIVEQQCLVFVAELQRRGRRIVKVSQSLQAAKESAG